MEIYNTWLAILAVACAATLGRWLRNGLEAAPVQPPAQAQTEAGNSGSTRAQPAVAQLAAAVQPPVSDTQAAAPPAQPAAREQTATPENTLAVARAAEAKRAAEKRRAERRQQWAEKRRQRQQQELRAGRAKSQGRQRAATIRGRAGENANASVSSVRFGMKVVSSLAAYTSSSVQTLKLTRMFGPKVWVIGTSAASRPWAIRTRPIRGMLLRASKVYQRPPI